MSNVVSIPKSHKPRPPQNEDELKAHAQHIRHKFITQHSVDFAFDVFRTMESHGFDLQQQENIKYDLVLIREAIKSALLRSQDEKHPLQEFAENIINLKDSDIDFNVDFMDTED